MKRRMQASLLCTIFLLSLLLTSCVARAETEGGVGSYAGLVSMEEVPVVDYAVPQVTANILVDLNGYPVIGRKEATIKGRRLPECFRLTDARTGEPVYDGAVREVVYDEELKLYFGYADFSDFEQTGLYYLECDVIGQSYRFEIRENFYAELFAENYAQVMRDCRDRTLSVADAVVVLETYEWYRTVFPDEDGDQVPDVLAELKGWAEYRESVGLDGEETALYAGFLAKLGYHYRDFERQYAADCLKRASTAFGQPQQASDRDADSFFALAELYRATGLATYRIPILDYKSFFESSGRYIEESAYLYGAMTYMSTRHPVDVDLCNSLMGSILDRAEETSQRYSELTDSATDSNNGTSGLLQRAIEVSCANYVMNNYQYTNIVEEFLHYLMGRNMESVDFYGRDGDACRYLLLLAQRAANEI